MLVVVGCILGRFALIHKITTKVSGRRDCSRTSCHFAILKIVPPRGARRERISSSGRYSFCSFRILLPTTKAGALQSSHTTRYPCVIWPCQIFGPSDVLMVPCAPFAWESPRVELTFSTRVPVRKAAEDCSVWERRVGVIKPSGRSFDDVEECDSRRCSSEPRSLALPGLLGGKSRQRHRFSQQLWTRFFEKRENSVVEKFDSWCELFCPFRSGRDMNRNQV